VAVFLRKSAGVFILNYVLKDGLGFTYLFIAKDNRELNKMA